MPRRVTNLTKCQDGKVVNCGGYVGHELRLFDSNELFFLKFTE